MAGTYVSTVHCRLSLYAYRDSEKQLGKHWNVLLASVANC